MDGLKKLIILCSFMLFNTATVLASESSIKYPTPEEAIKIIQQKFDYDVYEIFNYEEDKEILEFVAEMYGFEVVGQADYTNNYIELDNLAEYINTAYKFQAEPIIYSQDDKNLRSEGVASASFTVGHALGEFRVTTQSDVIVESSQYGPYIVGKSNVMSEVTKPNVGMSMSNPSGDQYNLTSSWQILLHIIVLINTWL